VKTDKANLQDFTCADLCKQLMSNYLYGRPLQPTEGPWQSTLLALPSGSVSLRVSTPGPVLGQLHSSSPSHMFESEYLKNAILNQRVVKYFRLC